MNNGAATSKNRRCTDFSVQGDSLSYRGASSATWAAACKAEQQTHCSNDERVWLRNNRQRNCTENVAVITGAEKTSDGLIIGIEKVFKKIHSVRTGHERNVVRLIVGISAIGIGKPGCQVEGVCPGASPGSEVFQLGSGVVDDGKIDRLACSD